MKNKGNKAVSIMEYSLILAVVIFAIAGMQIYMRRAICGRWRQAADTFGFGRQYDANYDPQYTGSKPALKIWGK